jgi:hypothetical protein
VDQKEKSFDKLQGEIERHQGLANDFLNSIPAYDDSRFSGLGIVICAGGHRHFTNAWVCMNMLRHVGCRLPIQLWHLGESELDRRMEEIMMPLGVSCVDAFQVAENHPARILNGWELKPYAMLHSPFQEVLLLDADNVPVRNPEFLFSTPQYQQTGALFWPDYGRLSTQRPIWRICEVPYRDEPEIESGQAVVDKKRCWTAMNLTMHYNEYSDFYYRFIHGDKCTFQLAFHRVDTPYAMPNRGIYSLDATMCQHDFDGHRLFQHRNLDKWRYDGRNRMIKDFQHEDQCRIFLEELRSKWTGRVWWTEEVAPDLLEIFEHVAEQRFEYVRVGYDQRPMYFNRDRSIGEGSATCERLWNPAMVNEAPSIVLLGNDAPTCRLVSSEDGTWRGEWYRYERMPIELKPV